MTISMFDSYVEYAIVARTQRIIDMSQATAYAQSTRDGRREMFNSWTNIISKVVTTVLQRTHLMSKQTIITWNGVPMGRKELLNQFRAAFGRRGVVGK